ncbi:MAG: globin domain-containing protein [Salinarimonas sp.]
MTPDQIALVRAGFRRAGTDADGFAAAFYARLLSASPGLAPLFAQTDMDAQRGKLVAVLAFVVNGLDRPETILDPARALARRHVGYGVEAAHYPLVGAALVDALGERLGDAFTHEARAAWIAAYRLLSGVMIAAAEDARAA